MNATPLTYQKAVDIYMKHAKKLEGDLANLNTMIKKFITGARKDAESNSRIGEAKELAKLEKDLGK